MDVGRARPPAGVSQPPAAADRQRADGRWSATRSGEDGLALAGRGLADTTRLASSPPDIWRDIAATNADEIGAGARRADRPAAASCARDLAEGDRLAEVFSAAARWRERLKT